MAWEACNSPRRGRSRKKPTGRVSSPCECLDPRTFDSLAAHRRVEDALKAISRQVRQLWHGHARCAAGPSPHKIEFRGGDRTQLRRCVNGASIWACAGRIGIRGKQGVWRNGQKWDRFP